MKLEKKICEVATRTFGRSNRSAGMDGWGATGPDFLVNPRLAGQKLDGKLPVGWDRPNRQCWTVVPRVRGTSTGSGFD